MKDWLSKGHEKQCLLSKNQLSKIKTGYHTGYVLHIVTYKLHLNYMLSSRKCKQFCGKLP